MLTDHDKENIKEILQDREKDITYRDWTRRVSDKVRDMTSLDDKVLNRQIRMLKKRLKNLESFYSRRIMLLSNTSLADKYDCAISTIERIDKKRKSGLEFSSFLQKRYGNEKKYSFYIGG